MRSAMMTLTVTVVALLAPCAAPGAQPATLSPGARVRVSTPSQPHARQVGTIMSLPTDSIVLHVAGRADLLAIPLAEVTGIEVSQGKRSQGRRGLGIGFLAGAGFGVMLGIAEGDDPPDQVKIIRLSAAEKALLGGAMLGVAGAVVGGVVGLASPTERWRRVPLAEAKRRVGVVPHPGGIGLSVSMQF